MENYEKEDCVSLYQSALTELEQAKMSGRISAAHEAIVARVEALRAVPGLHHEERHAIDDAMRALAFLQQEEAQFDVEAKRHAIERTLENLRSVSPAIKRVSGKAELE